MSSCGSAARAERAEEEMSEGRVITSRRRFVLKSWKAVEVEGRCFHRRDRRRRRDSWHYRSNYAADVCNVWRLRDLNRVLQDVESRFQRGVGVRLVFLTWCDAEESVSTHLGEETKQTRLLTVTSNTRGHFYVRRASVGSLRLQPAQRRAVASVSLDAGASVGVTACH